MSGADVVRTLRSITDNARTNTAKVESEVIDYIQANRSSVLRQLNASREITVPTSVGLLKVSLEDLEEALDAETVTA